MARYTVALGVGPTEKATKIAVSHAYRWQNMLQRGQPQVMIRTLCVVQASFVMLEHTDHVMALAAAPAAGLLASAGLSSQLFLWDIHTAVQLKPPAVRCIVAELTGVTHNRLECSMQGNCTSAILSGRLSCGCTPPAAAQRYAVLLNSLVLRIHRSTTQLKRQG